MGILSLLILIPLAGAALLHFVKNDNVAKIFTLVVSLITFVISLVAYFSFDNKALGFQLQERFDWITSKSVSISYFLGVDGCRCCWCC